MDEKTHYTTLQFYRGWEHQRVWHPPKNKLFIPLDIAKELHTTLKEPFYMYDMNGIILCSRNELNNGIKPEKVTITGKSRYMYFPLSRYTIALWGFGKGQRFVCSVVDGCIQYNPYREGTRQLINKGAMSNDFFEEKERAARVLINSAHFKKVFSPFKKVY